MTTDKFADPIEALGVEEDAPTQPRSKKRRGKSFDLPTDQLSGSMVAEATQSKVRAGRYVRKTLTFLPDQLAYVKKLANEEGVSMLAFMRWLVDQGLLAYENGERPVLKEKIVRGDPELSHWTSQAKE